MNEDSCNPLISIVIPTYNREVTLKRSIMSVLNQTYSNIQLIIIDDASTDNTETLIKSIQDLRLEYIKLKQKKGANHARNIGIKKARGEFIAFQDSDDEWLNQKLEKQLKHLQSFKELPEVSFCSYIINKKRKVYYLPKLEQIDRKGSEVQKLLEGNFITTPSLLVKSEVFKTVGGFDEEIKRLQDWEFLIRAACKYKLNFLDEPLLVVYYSDDSITSKLELLPEAFITIYEKHHILIKNSGKEGCFYTQIAKAYIKYGVRGLALKWQWQAVKLDRGELVSFLFMLFGRKGIVVEEVLLNIYKKLIN